MSHYQHIVIGLDFNPKESTQVIQRGLTLAKAFDAKVSLAHVVEPLALAYAGDIPLDLSSTQQSLESHAEKQLATIAKAHKIPAEDTHILLGATADELRGFANTHKVDCIVVGSHGRHGLALIFGSTANDVLHGAQCDVLAVRV